MARSDSSLAEIIRLIPGYDPYATAGDCWFDVDAAQHAIDFFQHPTDGVLRHIEGALKGERFVLEPWQQAITANIFGWKRKDSQGRVVRRYREVLVFVPRKNGKTPWAAALGLYVLACDDEQGQQNYIAAADREQAGMLFRHAKGMVELEPELSDRFRTYGGRAEAGQSRSIVYEKKGSFLRVISADAESKHGGNSHLILIDELHAQPNRELVDVLITSTVSLNRKQPLIVYITTADYDRESICNEKYDHACKVRDGILTDPSFLPVIYEASRDDDWTSPKTWKKANPNLGVSVSEEALARECKRAQETPSYVNTFLRLHLNIRTQNDVAWMDMHAWDSCGAHEPIAWRDQMLREMEGRECFAGLDLSTTTDLTALVLAFPEDDGYLLLPWFWIPSENMEQRKKRDRVDYSTWARQGFISATSGNVIDYDVVRHDINELAKKYNIREIACDRWNATQIITQLAGDGLTIFPYGQGFKDMTAPTKELERAVMSGTLKHGSNPVLRWNASNVTVETDSAGNLKPSKKKSTERIDGIVAACMGIGRAMLSQPATGPLFYC